jgi:hypothetical protein
MKRKKKERQSLFLFFLVFFSIFQILKEEVCFLFLISYFLKRCYFYKKIQEEEF